MPDFRIRRVKCAHCGAAFLNVNAAETKTDAKGKPLYYESKECADAK